ncbi:hypothetical protein KY290_023232 [Solanum tuberosum]|uniref:Mediator of RNA polymerase II transcription subunit 15a-like n=1 Tax=Solanum tuberosum TaxID=4113 RepID=A0ABQ7V6L8_SOLTU|nr:hypothetical protein KY290_023232 [Solanum tuberosum]
MDSHGGEGIDPAVVPTGEAAGALLDFAIQTGNADAADWQEEVYQQIKSMKEKYLSDIHDEYQNIASKVQQHDSLSPNENIEKLKMFKTKLEHIMVFLGLNKHDILVTHKEKLLWVEKLISFFLGSYRPRKRSFSLLQGQLPQSSIQLQQLQSLDGQTNPLMQPVHGSMAAMQQNNLTNPQHISLSGISTIYNSQQDRIISPATGFSQQNSVNSPQEVNISSLSSQSGMHPVQANLGSLWQNSSVLQQSLLKLHEQQMLQDQQLRQMYQQQQAFHSQQLMQHQQLFHRHQLMQQLLRQLQQQTVQLPAHKMSQLHQLTDVNDLMMRQQMGMKTGVLQQQQSVGQCVGFHHPQVKSEISSPQAYQAVSPQRQNLPAVDESKNVANVPWNFQ